MKNNRMYWTSSLSDNECLSTIVQSSLVGLILGAAVVIAVIRFLQHGQESNDLRVCKHRSYIFLFVFILMQLFRPAKN